MESHDLTPELEIFRQQYPVDEAAWAYLLKSGIDVQREVLKDFKPKEEGQADYSALVISFCKRRRQTQQQGQQVAPPQDMAVAEERRSLEGEVQAFRVRYPCDDAAYNYIMASHPSVIRDVLANFKAKKEGESDYSPLVISFAKKCRSSAFSWVEDQAEYEAFRSRYPFDDDTHNYMQTSNPDVRRYVMRNFKPPREGEADYSALLITYCKNCRNNMQSNRMQGGMPSGMQGMQGGMGMGGAQWSKGGVSGMPGAQNWAAWGKGGWEGGNSTGWDGSWSACGGCTGGCGACGACGTSGCGGCAYGCAGCGCGACGACGACGGCGGCCGCGAFNGCQPGPIDQTALWSFRQRYPMDDGAFQFLCNAPAHAQQMVIDSFAPNRQDSDYSALVINFTKRCAQGQPPVKRPRLGP